MAYGVSRIQAILVFKGAVDAMNLDRIVTQAMRPFRRPAVAVVRNDPVHRVVRIGLDDEITGADGQPLLPSVVKINDRAAACQRFNVEKPVQGQFCPVLAQ